MDLEKLEKTLQEKDFDTSSAGNVLSANFQTADNSVEITIDSEGRCLVKKEVRTKQSSKPMTLANQKISKISYDSKISQIRLLIASEKDLEEILKLIFTPLF